MYILKHTIAWYVITISRCPYQASCDVHMKCVYYSSHATCICMYTTTVKLPILMLWCQEVHCWCNNPEILCSYEILNCDRLWENPPVTHKDNYLEKRNWIIQSIISPEGLKLQACNLQHSYCYSRSIRLSYVQCIASWISHHFRWSSAFFKVKWPTRKPHCTQTVTKHS